MTLKSTNKGVSVILGELLSAKGFEKHKNVFLRRRGDLVDVVDAQKDKSGEKVTFNLGVFVPASHELIWGEQPSVVEEPFCAVRSRIGAIVGNVDLWWGIKDRDALGEAFNMLVEHGLPYIEQFNDFNSIAKHLEKGDAIKKYGPIANLQLVSMLYLEGKVADAQETVLREIQRLPGAWRQRALLLAERANLRQSD